MSENTMAPVDPATDNAIVENEDRSITIALADPVAVTVKKGGADSEIYVDRLTLRRPRARDFEVLDGFGSKQVTGLNAMIAHLASPALDHAVAKLVVRKLDVEDWARASKVVGNFIPEHLKTGTD